MIPYKSSKRTTPKWMASFTYILILMLSFFILLLSFSQLDVNKYKKMVLSLQYVLNFAVHKYDNSLSPNASMVLQEYTAENTNTVVKSIDNPSSTFQDLAQKQPMIHQSNDLGISVAQELTKEIKDGIIELQTGLGSINICLNEKYSFESGSAEIKNDSYPVLYKIANIIAQNKGTVVVAGFTDDVPVQNGNFHDNWELSAMRAYKVLKALLDNGNNAERFTLVANAANHPLYANTSISGRAKNRRVEITLMQPLENSNNSKPSIKVLTGANNSNNSLNQENPK